MTLMKTDSGVACDFNARFNDSWPAGGKDLTLKLFVNDHTLADTDTSASFTEAAGGGYSAKTLTCGSWTVGTVSGIVQAAYAQQIFTFTGPLTGSAIVYGYYVVDSDGVLQWAERLAAACMPSASGNHIDVTPVHQGSKGTPT